jgi:hypothetical protein
MVRIVGGDLNLTRQEASLAIAASHRFGHFMHPADKPSLELGELDAYILQRMSNPRYRLWTASGSLLSFEAWIATMQTQPGSSQEVIDLTGEPAGTSG